MCLVHSNEANLHVIELELKEVGVQPFGRKIEKLVAAKDDIVKFLVDFVARKSRVYGRGADALLAQMLHLVFH